MRVCAPEVAPKAKASLTPEMLLNKSSPAAKGHASCCSPCAASEIPARLHFTFSFHRFSCPIADKQDGQLCKPPEGDRQALPRRQRARESLQQLVTSVPVSSEIRACLRGASKPWQGGTSHRCEEGRYVQEQRITPASPRRRARLAIERHFPVPRFMAVERRALEGNSCPPDVHAAGRVPGRTATLPAVPASLWGWVSRARRVGNGAAKCTLIIGVGSLPL